MANGIELDFEGLARDLLSRAREILPVWLPGGKLVGSEYMCGNLRGEPGDSLRVNVNTGLWADFSGTEKGGDLISVYAAIQGIGQGEAAKRLADETGYELREAKPQEQTKAKPEIKVSLPPRGVEAPNMVHPRFGDPSMSWCYRDSSGEPMFYVSRYESEDGKQILPWSWSENKWINKGLPSPRPLYGLDELAKKPKAPVLVVEGEKAADAARQIAGHIYAVVTWPNGAKAIKNADWSPVYGRNVLIWPDADEPGEEAATLIAEVLNGKGGEVKVIDPQDKEGGWDAADALAEGWDWATLKAWAGPRASIVISAKAQASAVSSNGTAQAAAQTNLKISIEAGSDQDEGSETFYALWDKYGITSAKNGQPICNVDNVLRAFDGMPEMNGLVWYDEFHAKHFTNWNSSKPREWADIDTLKLTAILQRKLGLSRISDDIVHKAVMVYADQTIRNEPRDWMDSLQWDGVERIENFFIDSFGMEESDYARAASKNWWVSMAARIFNAGCKVDTMVVIEGAQGTFKSMALSIIGGDWFAEAQESPLSKDFYMALHGKLIIEVSEMDAFRRAEDTLIKRLLGCRSDRFRPPYGRASRDFPRRCVFVGTTNEDTYLKDHTGSRRFWPVRIGRIDIQKLKDEREQLFAEAVKCYKAGDPWHVMPLEQTLAQQEDRRQSDEWESVILEYLRIRDEVKLSDVATEALKIDISKLDIALQRRIGKVLWALGWTKHNAMRGKEKDQFKIWRSPTYYGEQLPF